MTAKPQTERRQDARRALLKAAATEFSTLGFEGGSLNRIAETANVSKQRLVYYFGTKTDLWKETTDWVFRRAEADFAHAITQFDADKPVPIEKIIGAYAAVSARHPAYVLIPMIEGVRSSWRTRYLAENYLRRHNEAFASLIRDNAQSEAAETADNLSLQLLAAGGVQLLIGLLPLWRESGALEELDEAVARYAEAVTDLLSTRP